MTKRFLAVIVALIMAAAISSVCVFAAENHSGGFVVDFGDDYHGILLNGQVVSLPHDLDENGVCTVCGYGAAEASVEGDVGVETPQEPTDNVDDPEDGDSDNLVVTDTPDDNPKTGVVLAVIPMLVAAAAIVVSRKRN